MTFLWGGVFLLSLVSFFFRMRAKDGRVGPDEAGARSGGEVLDAEVARRSKPSWEQLVTELHEVRAYQVEVESTSSTRLRFSFWRTRRNGGRSGK